MNIKTLFLVFSLLLCQSGIIMSKNEVRTSVFSSGYSQKKNEKIEKIEPTFGGAV